MPEEGSGEGKDLRIGVFVCHCGSNIGGVVDVPAVVEYARTLPGVAYSEGNMYTCAEDGLAAIRNGIRENDLNRVIVASCTPRTHAPLFQATCEEAGLNRYLFTFVNLREHCSWVHMEEKERATEKARELVRMGVARASLLEPKEEERIDVRQSALVIGGGVAGLTASTSLARQGFQTHLVEKTGELGGYTRKIDHLFLDDRPGEEVVKPLVEDARAEEDLDIHLNTTVKRVDGFIGNFDVVLEKDGNEETVEVGTIVVAVGHQLLDPEDLYGHGSLDKVVTLHEFEEMIRKEEVPELKRIAFIQCAGSRGQRVSYCSRVCCNSTVRKAIDILENRDDLFKAPEEAPPPAAEAGAKPEKPAAQAKPGRMMRRRRRAGPRQKPGAKPGAPSRPAKPSAPGSGVDVLVFYRDIMAYGTDHEYHYNKARQLGARFNQYTPDRLPEVSRAGDRIAIKFFHTALQQEMTEEVDMVVLATPMVAPRGAKDLSQMLKVPLGQEGFFFEAHVKLRPVDFATDGVFVCGTAKGPVDVPESISQAFGAASRAGSVLKKGYVQQECLQSSVDQELCVGCGTCEAVCAYSAIKVGEDGKAETITAACKGCGACASVCPQNAITMMHYTDEQILNEALAALEEGVRPAQEVGE